MEFRTLTNSIIDVDEKSRIVKGIFASFDNINSHGEIFKKGAFKKSILEAGPGAAGNRKIKHLANHWFEDVIGVIQVLEEKKEGLYFETFTGRHTLGMDSMYMYLDKVITEHSIGFEFVKDKTEEMEEGGRPSTIVREVKLWEGSYVTFGSDSNTPNLTGRSESDIISYAKRLEHIIKNSGNYTDETFEKFELELKNIHEYMVALRKKSQPEIIAPQPINYERILSRIKI